MTLISGSLRHSYARQLSNHGSPAAICPVALTTPSHAHLTSVVGSFMIIARLIPF